MFAWINFGGFREVFCKSAKMFLCEICHIPLSAKIYLRKMFPKFWWGFWLSNSTLQVFGLLEMMDYIDWFVTDYGNFKMSFSFSKIKVCGKNMLGDRENKSTQNN